MVLSSKYKDESFRIRLETHTQRVKEVYAERDNSGKAKLYTWNCPDEIYASYRKKAVLARALKKVGLKKLDELEILDVGCGTGSWLRMLIEWDATPSRLHGVDLLENRILKAKKISFPEIDFRINNSWPLPYPDSSMDICAASTVFSSILEDEARNALSEEMVRIVRTKGMIIIFDYVFSDPRNINTIGIDLKKIQKLFPELNLIKTYRLILAPPLLRLFSEQFIWIAHSLETFFPLLCTHRLFLLKK